LRCNPPWLRERRGDPRMTIAIEGGQAALQHDGRILCAFPTAKHFRETMWNAIALRSAF
jgi:hypothetical protein